MKVQVNRQIAKKEELVNRFIRQIKANQGDTYTQRLIVNCLKSNGLINHLLLTEVKVALGIPVDAVTCGKCQQPVAAQPFSNSAGTVLPLRTLRRSDG